MEFLNLELGGVATKLLIKKVCCFSVSDFTDTIRRLPWLVVPFSAGACCAVVVCAGCVCGVVRVA